jgi:hypothetical protein
MTTGKGMSKLRDDGRQGVSTGIVNSRQKLPVFATVDLISRILQYSRYETVIPSQQVLEPSLLFVEVPNRSFLIHADV